MCVLFLLYFEYCVIFILMLSGDLGWFDESWSIGLVVLGICCVVCWFDCGDCEWNLIWEVDKDGWVCDIVCFEVFEYWIFWRVVVVNVW